MHLRQSVHRTPSFHTYIHTHMLVYIHTHIHTYIHTHILVYIHTHINKYIHTHTHKHEHTYIHTYVHTVTSVSSPHTVGVSYRGIFKMLQSLGGLIIIVGMYVCMYLYVYVMLYAMYVCSSGFWLEEKNYCERERERVCIFDQYFDHGCVTHATVCRILDCLQAPLRNSIK